MTTYIALLRGINVGGKNIIDMKQLKAAFADAGFTQVRTYINSGNVLFSSELDSMQLRSLCRELIAESFKLDIAVVLLSADELAEALSHAPDWWGRDADSRHNAMFVIPPATAEDICAEVGEIKPEYEKISHYGNLIFWSAPIKTFSRTRWSSVPKLKAYQKITIRNSNTAFKLAALSKENQ